MIDAERAALYQKARRHLNRRDPVLKELMGRLGPCTLSLEPGSFVILVRAIVSQLISTAAARTIYGRLEALTGAAGVTPASLLALGEDRIRPAGLSGAKARALIDLAGLVQGGLLPLEKLPEMSDA